MSSVAPTRQDVQMQLAEKAQRNPEFRKALLADPKAALAEEFGIPALPTDLDVIVLEESTDQLYLVIPAGDRESPQSEQPSMVDTRWI